MKSGLESIGPVPRASWIAHTWQWVRSAPNAVLGALLLACSHGWAAEPERPDVPAAIPVGVAIYVKQINEIDQRRENFTAVVELRLSYRDARLLESTSMNGTAERLFTIPALQALTIERGVDWPEVVFDNQQGRMDVSVELASMSPLGDVEVLFRFTSAFQAPEFDFRRFPFDKQVFYVHATLALPKDVYVFEERSGISGVADAHGEEEWLVTDVSTKTTTITDELGLERSRFTLEFSGRRHLTYYIVRIFLPIIIILLVSWFTFLLQDYVKRIDVGISNLLLFIAFSFSVASDLPRLGYLTALDVFMTGTFLITGAVLLISVVFRYLQNNDRAKTAARWDRYVFWGYWPMYVVGMSGTLLRL